MEGLSFSFKAYSSGIGFLGFDDVNSFGLASDFFMPRGGFNAFLRVKYLMFCCF